MTPKASPSTVAVSHRNWKSRPRDMGYQPVRSAIEEQKLLVARRRSHGLVAHVTNSRLGSHDPGTFAPLPPLPLPPPRRARRPARAQVRQLPPRVRREPPRRRQRRRRERRRHYRAGQDAPPRPPPDSVVRYTKLTEKEQRSFE